MRPMPAATRGRWRRLFIAAARLRVRSMSNSVRCSSRPEAGSAPRRGLRGAKAAAILLEIRGASGRPASRSSGATHRRHPKRCGDILGPGAALPVVPRRIEAPRGGFRPGMFQAGRPASVGPLRLVVTLPAESGLASAEATRAHLVRRHLRRRDPSPEKQTVCSSRPHGRGMRAL
jgi:hypothetical protein